FVRGGGLRVSDRMTPLERLVVHQGPASPGEAERIMVERKVKKLPLVNADGSLLGLVTARDLLRQRRLPFATRDGQGRLRVGAAATQRASGIGPGGARAPAGGHAVSDGAPRLGGAGAEGGVGGGRGGGGGGVWGGRREGREEGGEKAEVLL